MVGGSFPGFCPVCPRKRRVKTLSEGGEGKRNSEEGGFWAITFA